MFVRNTDEAPTASKQGVVSHVLLRKGDVPGDDLVVTWVDVEPGERQMRHHHEPEQVYVVVAGSGRMHVGDETASVERGDMVHIPSNVDHYVVNTGEEPLTYVSAGTPTMDVRPFYEDPE